MTRNEVMTLSQTTEITPYTKPIETYSNIIDAEYSMKENNGINVYNDGRNVAARAISVGASSTANIIGSMKSPVKAVGSATGAFGSLGILTPYIIIERPIGNKPSSYSNQIGLTNLSTKTLGNLKGFVKVKDVHVDNISQANQHERDEIENLLKGGVIL